MKRIEYGNVTLQSGCGCYCSHTSQSEVFFVSAAQRKSQKTREQQRQTTFLAVCVHREACYWAQPGRGVNSKRMKITMSLSLAPTIRTISSIP